ncbi:MAG: hypothetical protein Q8Q15_03880 [bacterium]|nr:hypothetical protein [bacterium]
MIKHRFWLTIGLYLLSRFLNLLSLPIFNDESIYLHWGKIMVSVPNQAFYSLFDGKPPLFLWLLGLAQNLPLDPLIAGRIVSILFGLATLLGILQTSKLLGLSKQGQILAGIFYIASPLNIFFDRLAILDSAISSIFIWILYFSIRISQLTISNRQSATHWIILITLGITQGLGLWLKGTSQLFLFLPFLLPLSTLVLQKDVKKAAREAIFFLLSFLIAELFFFPVRFQPLFAVFQKREGDFLVPINQAVEPSNWLPHLSLISLTSLIYLGPFVLLFAVLGFLKLYKKEPMTSLFLALSFFLPLAFEILFARYFLSRYYLFTFLPLFIFSAYGLTTLTFPKPLKTLILLVTLFVPTIISLSFLLNPLFTISSFSFTPSLKSDMFGYTSGWPSGYGVKEAADWLKNESEKSPILVITRADSGNPEDAMFVYLSKNKNILLAQTNREPAKEELEPFKNLPIYFVSRGEQYLDMFDRLEEMAIFPKPLDSEFVGVYKLVN